MKKNKATARNTAAISAKAFLQAVEAAIKSDETATHGNAVLWRELIDTLPKLSNAAKTKAPESAPKGTARKCETERAHKFLSGSFSKRELNEIGVENVYKLMSRFYAELNTANSVYSFHEYFSAWEHPDLRAILEARKTGGVKVCGEGVDVAIKLWELEDGLSLAHNKTEREKMQQQIGELKGRLHDLREEIYETMKRGERRARSAGTLALDGFYAAKNAALVYGKPDMKQEQRERAARWLIAENAAGHKASVVDAGRQFGNEIEAEKAKGGYKNVESLIKALNSHAGTLGIEQFITRRKGNGKA